MTISEHVEAILGKGPMSTGELLQAVDANPVDVRYILNGMAMAKRIHTQRIGKALIWSIGGPGKAQ